MKVLEKDIIKVLALFDKEDIPYINFEYLLNNKIIELNKERRNTNSKVKVRKLGGRNDRPRK